MTAPITIAPGLDSVLLFPEPPTLDFFRSLSRSLPKVHSKAWGVYALLLEKPGCSPALYVGSGTNSAYGVAARFKDYDRGTNIPRFVTQAFNHGYTLSHSGLLCWTPMPSAELCYHTRARFLAFEAFFNCLFHAAFPAITDTYYEWMMPWERRHIVSWTPLCSHLSFREKITGREGTMTAEERAARAVQNAKVQPEKAKAKDLEAYQAADRRRVNAWNEGHRDRS